MKKFLSIVLAIMCLFAFTGFIGEADRANVSGRQEAPTKKVLRVGTDSASPPFAYYQEASKTHIGFDIEMMQGLAGDMGYGRVEFIQTDADHLLTSLQDGKVDAVISHMTVTDEQRSTVDFTESYLDRSSVVIALSGTDAHSADAMKDKRIAVVAGSTYKNQAKAYSGAVVECGSTEEALQAVLDQKVDFAVMDHYTARFYVANFYKDRLRLVAELPDDTKIGVGIAVAKGNKEMLDKLNAALQNYRGTAAYYQMKRSYFGRLEE